LALDPSADPNGGLQLHKYRRLDGWVDDGVIMPHFSVDGILWIGMHGGVSRFDGASIVNFTTTDGLGGRVSTYFSSTPEGVLWFGTEVCSRAVVTP